MAGVRRLGWLGCGAMAGAMLLGGVAGWAESCTTQSQMQAADREALAGAARTVAAKIQAGDGDGLQALTVAEFARSFAGMRSVAMETAPRLKSDQMVLDEIFLLDAAQLQAGSEAQFFCTLNKSQNEVDFSISGLTAGVYGFALVNGVGGSPYRLSMLLRRDAGRWLLAGFFPGPTEAMGHDGVWYWREARRVAKLKQPWTAWLYYTESQQLMKPAGFVQTTHLERLQEEQKAAAPPALSGGISSGTPLVVKGPDGAEYRFTGLAGDGTLGHDRLEVLAHVEAATSDPAALRAASDGAARALVAAYPELKTSFSGVLTSLEAANQSPLVTDHLMTSIH